MKTDQFRCESKFGKFTMPVKKFEKLPMLVISSLGKFRCYKQKVLTDGYTNNYNTTEFTVTRQRPYIYLHEIH